MNRRLEEIHKKNAEYEKKSPYNFCDRWCERCPGEKQIRCSLYNDELERKMICIAHGKDEDDAQMTERILEEQYKETDKKLSEDIDKSNIDLDFPEIDEDALKAEEAIELEDLPEDIQKHIRFVMNNPLDITAMQYQKKTHDFLKKTYYKNENLNRELKYSFETIAWYYTLLSAKLHRALCGFHEPGCKGDLSLYDAIAQFQICKKAISESIEALNRIKKRFPAYNLQILKLLALLQNISSRIEILEAGL